MKTSKVPKGKAVPFASGGKRPMFGKGDRIRTSYPAEPQKPGRTGQHATKSASKRTGAKVRSAERQALHQRDGNANPATPDAAGNSRPQEHSW
jgi:hypothetical protein